MRILPPETLIHILHYFPRKQLVKRFSRVNSSFFNVANQLSPNVHVINEDNIKFSTKVVYESIPYVETFEALTLGKYQKSDSRFGKAMNKMTKKRITAAEYLENMPPAFIRFPKFAIHACPDEVLLKFLRDSKQHFENCRLYFSRTNPAEKHLQKVEETFSDTFLNPAAIYFSDLLFVTKKFFNTTGARNCDKLELWIQDAPKCTKDIFMEWIQWKQNQPGSRRHLVLVFWWYALAAEMVEDLKHAFETATQPLSYVITFVIPYYPSNRNYDDEVESHSEFHLDNERTRERLSLFKDRRDCFRLWRRTVTSSDSTWLRALIGETYEEIKDAARETRFDEKFYYYRIPESI
ncbi:hypothetical protein Ddc_14010 [Ditylenchus destructor]|nr:hypothetical protein Ddc_14010 [Ditylenchus destructor]